MKATHFRISFWIQSGLCLLVFILLVSSSALAQERPLNVQDIDRKLSTAESKLNQLNVLHAQIKEKHVEIQNELSSLKIWIRRSRGG